MGPLFLTLDEVLAIHQDRISKYGGTLGIRDRGLLESALGTAQATFGGAYLHETIFEMAAAYLFHICRNHPFLGGNKRTALACALTFLRLNNVRIKATEDELYDLVMGVAAGRISKSEVAVFFQRHSR